MRFSLESMGGSLENTGKVERIDNLGFYEYPSREAIERYLDVIGSTENIKAFNIAFLRFSRAIEHANTIEDCETIIRDIGIYERGEMLSYDEFNALEGLTTKCFVKINFLKMNRELTRTNVSKPLDFINEVKEMVYTSNFHDPASDPSESLIPSNSTTQEDDKIAKFQEALRASEERWRSVFAKERRVHLNDQAGNPSESLTPSNSTTQDDDEKAKLQEALRASAERSESVFEEEGKVHLNNQTDNPSESLTPNNSTTHDDEELDSLKELRAILNEIGGNEPPKDKKQLDYEVKQILDSLEDSSLVDIVPTKEERKAKAHVIKARKKNVPKKVKIRKIVKPGLPGEMLEDDTTNLTRKR